MFDIDKELNDIRNITAFPPKELIDDTKKLVEDKINRLDALRKVKKKNNIIKFTTLSVLPAAASILFAVAIGLAMPKAAVRYSLDINPNMTMSANDNGIVLGVEYDDEDAWENLDKKALKGEPIEYAISEAIISAQENGYIMDNENVLIGCFGDVEHNNISKNQILSYLSGSISEDISLMSVYGTEDDWKEAENSNISAGLYALSMMADDITISEDMTLDKLIYEIENQTSTDIVVLLAANAELIVYRAPQLRFSTIGDHVVFSWDYVDYRNNNYDGNIIYQLVSSQSYDVIFSSPRIIDTYVFASWEKQPVDYTLLYDKDSANKYYAIIVVYDDGTRVINNQTVFVP